MIWALRTRRASLLFLLALAVGWWAGLGGRIDLPLPFPHLSSAAPSVPLPAVPALTLIAGIHLGLRRAELPWMDSSVRSPQRLSLGLQSALMLVSTVAALCAELTGDGAAPGADAALYVRNLLAFAALAESAALVSAAQFSALTPVVYFCLSCLFARDTMGGIRLWAWPLDRDPWNPFAWGVAAVGWGIASIRCGMKRTCT